MSDAITMRILWHLPGAAHAACFCAPFKKVTKWSSETMCSISGRRPVSVLSLGCVVIIVTANIVGLGMAG